MSDLLLRFGATPCVLVLTDEEVFQAACLHLDREERCDRCSNDIRSTC